MAITTTLVPAGQTIPPGFQSLARIRCRRQLPSWEHFTHREKSDLYLPLPVLGEEDVDELWLVEKRAETSLQQRYQNGIQTSQYGDYCFHYLWFKPQLKAGTSYPSIQHAASQQIGNTALDQQTFCIPSAIDSFYAQQCYFAYQAVLKTLYPGQYLQKIWHYIPAINQGEGDEENYRQFCRGREQALLESELALSHLPAATAIGIPAGEAPALFYWVTGPAIGTNVENPRQVSAIKYPRQYGPAKPNFSRATISDCAQQFLISGTASVVGHKTAHPFALEEQTNEMLNNLSSLMDNAQRAGTSAQSEQLAGIKQLTGPLRLYLRQPEAHQQTLTQCQSAGLPTQQLVSCHGEICRSDLMVEIDGVQSLA